MFDNQHFCLYVCAGYGAAKIIENIVYCIIRIIHTCYKVDECDHGVFDTPEYDENSTFFDPEECFYETEEPIEKKELFDIRQRCADNAKLPAVVEKGDLNTLEEHDT